MVKMASQKKLRQTEIGSIPADWKLLRVGSHFDFKNGLNKSKQFFGHGTPIINYMDVYAKSAIHKKDVAGKVELSNDEINRYRVKKGDVFFTRTSETLEEVGKAAVLVEAIEDCVFSGFILRARPLSEDVAENYRKYCFSSRIVRNQIISSGTYTTRALTNGRLLSQVLLPTPPTITEQNAIAKSLSDIEKLIEAISILIEKKILIKKGVMQELVTGRRRLPEFKEVWQEVEMGEIAEVFTGGTPSTIIDSFWGGKIPWMNSGELNQKKVFEVEGRITEVGLNNSSTSLVPIRCILMGLAGQGKTRGTVAINYIELCINQSIGAIKVNPSIYPEYIYYNLDLRYHEIRSLSTGASGRGALNLGIIKKISVRIPPTLEEQKAIADIIEDIDLEIQLMEEQQAKLIKIKDGMMQQLLTGRVRLV